ncbi:hypothetical protein Q3O60_14535 [Alkalimonas collagenimarina]|uniref:Lipoprotein n=1 Tax=Alkalimonas collagenimarina TaxID=400390 RepID=A0ABT9H282_9GAMM|nr:hypothetical protein [Alkalimonas collagenimarina]MDP4537407.1 hypothetical protein [Alkalimonas collagenimarina]
MQRSLLVIILLLMLQACQPLQQNYDSELLLYGTTTEQLTISPANVPVESLLRLDFQTVDTVVAITGEIIGVSMYMGRIPLHFSELNATHWRAELLLGACSDPAMEWRIIVTVQYASGKEQLLSETFRSSWG